MPVVGAVHRIKISHSGQSTILDGFAEFAPLGRKTGLAQAVKETLPVIWDFELN
jgi:hypothetical protein